MLRHIVSVGLAMTVCATFMPTKASAVTLTFTPVGEIPKKPGDSITFIFSLNPGSSSPSRFISFTEPGYDGSELSLRTNESFTVSANTLITNTITVATRTFDVLTPVRDGKSDIFNISALYRESNLPGTPLNPILPVSSTSVADVVPEPVPEPLTMFGTALGLGCGVLFKRKSSKKTVF
jgi:PEP-CTERM putative exosortase interaction domain